MLFTVFHANPAQIFAIFVHKVKMQLVGDPRGDATKGTFEKSSSWPH